MKKIYFLLLILFANTFAVEGEVSGVVNIDNKAKLSSGGTTDIYGSLFGIINAIGNEVYNTINNALINIVSSPLLAILFTFVLLIWAIKKISQADFEIPKDIIQIAIFLILLIGINFLANNPNSLRILISYLDLPNALMNEVLYKMANSLPNNPDSDVPSTALGYSIQSLWNSTNGIVMTAWDTANPGLLKAFSVIHTLIAITLLYIMMFITIVTLTLTAISVYIQLLFWKSFALIMLPLLFFDKTRGIFFQWLKTLISLSIISGAIGLSAYVGVAINDWNTKGMEQASSGHLMIDDVMLSVLGLYLTFKLGKEIPSFINSLFSIQGQGGSMLGSMLMGQAIGGAAKLALAATPIGRAVGLAKTGMGAVGGAISNTASQGISKASGAVGGAISSGGQAIQKAFNKK